MESKFYKQLTKLENKLKVYKKEMNKLISFNKQYEKLIVNYETAIDNLSQKSKSKLNEQNLKNKIFVQYLA